MSGESIIVYGNFTLDLKKYPRRGTKQEKTDIIIINFLMHEEFLTKCAKSLDDAIKYYNACKEYSYTFSTPESPEFPRVTKRYTAKEIIQLHNMLTMRPIRTGAEYLERMRGFSLADQVYISYLSCKDFYMNLFGAIKGAKDAHFERREYHYRVIPPMEIFGHLANPIVGQIYSAYELMELFTYTHYLKKHHILKELPVPSFVSKLQEMAQSQMMRNLYPAVRKTQKPTPIPIVTSFYEEEGCRLPATFCSSERSQEGCGQACEDQACEEEEEEEEVGVSINDTDLDEKREESGKTITLGEKLRMIKEKRRLESGMKSPIQCGMAMGKSCGFGAAPSPGQAYLKNSVSQAVAWDSKRSHISN